jgi:phage-related protein
LAVRTERNIIFHGTHFMDFYIEQTVKVQEKIEYVFKIIKQVDRVPEKFLKHLEGTNGLYEIRIEHESNIYRIFCCFDMGNLVILFNAFQKKTQKTPKQEIELAEKLKKEYFTIKDAKNEKGKIKKR